MTTPARHPKPDKPRPDFPLFAHRNGQWAKKIRGKLHYFGTWNDPDGALRCYVEQRDYLHAGLAPPSDSVNVRDVCNAFMDAQDVRLQIGEIVRSTHEDYLRISKLLVNFFDRQTVASVMPTDWNRFRASISDVSPHTLNRRVTAVRTIFNWAYESALIEVPVRFGPDFKFTSMRARRKHDQQRPSSTLTAATIRKMLNAANPRLHCWILLGINCGFYSVDISSIERRHIDGEFVDFPRPKTAIERRCWLWPETQQAVAKIAQSEGQLFLSRNGQPLNVSYGKTRTDLVKNHWTEAKRKLGVKWPGGFSSLRHTYRTIADDAGDQPAANYSMGHAQTDMADNYRHEISDARLTRVASHVRGWLFENIS